MIHAEYVGGVCAHINHYCCFFLVTVHVTVYFVKILEQAIHPHHYVLDLVAFEQLLDYAFSAVNRVGERLTDDQIGPDLPVGLGKLRKNVVIALLQD